MINKYITLLLSLFASTLCVLKKLLAIKDDIIFLLIGSRNKFKNNNVLYEIDAKIKHIELRTISIGNVFFDDCEFQRHWCN